MLFIALTEWTSKVNNAGKKSYRTIEENGLVTQRMVAVIPDIGIKAFFKKKNLT